MISAFLGHAQERDFKKMSPRERSEMAEREMLEAAQDGTFLNLMDQGHALFVQKHYLKAIHKYEEARERRPNNVYPPVIIRDIELSMKDTLKILREREEERVVEQQTRKQPELPDREQRMEEFREQEKIRQEQVANWEDSERERLARARVLKEEDEERQRQLGDTRGRDVPDATMEDFQRDLAKQYGEGVTQRTYRDGSRTVTERIVVRGSVGNEYKRVEHPWGGKFYFKNGKSISEETWNQETR